VRMCQHVATNLFLRLWGRTPLWAKAVALVLGAAVFAAWSVLAVVGIMVWYESPLYCPPTMGCPTLGTQGCKVEAFSRPPRYGQFV
jgi:hypothetical protein